jgi:hypothetical protein
VPRFSSVSSRRDRGRRGISTTGWSREGRSAGLKSCVPTRGGDKGNATKMLDNLCRERHKQWRRLGQERRRSQMDDRADRATVVGVVPWVLCGRGRTQGRCRARDRYSNRRGRNPVECRCPNDRTSCSAIAVSASQLPLRFLVRTQRIRRA